MERQLLGNYPQGDTNLALVRSALTIASAEGARAPAADLRTRKGR